MYGLGPEEPAGPWPGHSCVELVGGPLDGTLLDVCGWDPQGIVGHAMVMSEHDRFGPGGGSEYVPAEGHVGEAGRFVRRGEGSA
ncbi:hypothetical protein ACIRBY_25180 [Streptomyces sp. NPDC096136]|uniref:hypothetical protein n=1 Tax=Streptomyces sp. NPDC096136 TaxID=3366076 RepID=UPI00382DABAD